MTYYRMTNLEWLNLLSSNISDVSPLSGMTNLLSLGLSGNNISDVSPLSGMADLVDLELALNNISDVPPLSGLNNLEKLVLFGNKISDIAPLVANMGLGSGDRVDVRNNPLSATSINTHIPALQNRGIDVLYDASRSDAGKKEPDISPTVEGWKADDYIYHKRINAEK